MANVSRIAGLIPVQYLNGSEWNGKGRTYFISSSNTNAFAIGDPVDIAGSADTNGIMEVTLATAGTICLGPIIQIGEQEDIIGNINTPNTIIAPATKVRAYYVQVCDDPGVIFEIQEGGTQVAALAAANVGQNANLVTGTNNGYVSGWTLDAATTETTASLNLKLLGLVRKPNNAFGQYAKWLVLINAHRFKSVGTLGV